jgi:uncharacterized protein (TIGR02452 family)
MTHAVCSSSLSPKAAPVQNPGMSTCQKVSLVAVGIIGVGGLFLAPAITFGLVGVGITVKGLCDCRKGQRVSKAAHPILHRAPVGLGETKIPSATRVPLPVISHSTSSSASGAASAYGSPLSIISHPTRSSLARLDHPALPRFTPAENIAIYRDTQREYSQFPKPTAEKRYGTCTMTHAWYPDSSIEVLNMSTSRAAYMLVHEPLCHPLILDMANPRERLGGVERGAEAQEERLARQSTLGNGLTDAMYPLAEDQNIVVEGVTFFRNDEYTFLEHPFQADVIVSAALYLDPMKPVPADYEDRTKEIIRRILGTAGQSGRINSLVLGAFGCGAFHNNPATVARLFKEVLDDPMFQGRFKKIVFAIVDDPTGPSNYAAFKREFARGR